MFGPVALAGIFEPEDAAGGAAAVADEDVEAAIAVHVDDIDGHDPADAPDGMPAPGFEVAGVGGGFEPADPGAVVFAGSDEVDTVAAIDLHGRGEHPLHDAGGGGQGLGDPAAGAVPMDVHGARFAFGGADDIGAAVAIEVHGDSVLGVTHRADLFAGPFFPDLRPFGLIADANGAAFLPSGDNIEAAVSVHVSEADAVGALAFAIDRMHRPRALGQHCQKQQVNQSFSMAFLRSRSSLGVQSSGTEPPGARIRWGEAMSRARRAAVRSCSTLRLR